MTSAKPRFETLDSKSSQGRRLKNIYTHIHDSPVGPIYIAVTRDGALVRASFTEDSFWFDPSIYNVERNKYACGEVAWQLDQYFSGERKTFDLAYQFEGGTEFEQDVWRRLLKIEYGETITYGQIAQKVGRKNAAQAVGNAVGKNPIVICLPCHRVVPASGGLGYYSTCDLPKEEGTRIKRQLLGLEGALTAALDRSSA